ncbi:lactate dehydrogenase B [Basidiobolus meristosporus CBS 931.73]|uniref:Lactate dehydrogenase B n=1 Tax=Basidiobolus meristosporus CBS 931.73 TaxID=1314790 RepID=A0A1Y1Y7L3_9FUNG|nr:lactate dehydrogenase B [Basidiobolus meristosporus CBS 931.73]|eukprot:ORX93993.1 lactate dehydrogenase B [Basidiobolus meristosporus CBS 931.73]
MPANKTIAIIGCGAVGASCASSIILRNVSCELLMVDINQKVAEGQALDLSDSQFLSSTKVRVGTYQEAGQADIIRPGETRLQLIAKNFNILNSVITSMAPIKPTAKIMLVANPVDVLTHIAQKISGLPKNQVFGSGTFLDSGRLRLKLSEILGVSEPAIHCYAMGEHGDHQFVGWSSAMVGGVPLLDYPQMQGVDLDKLQYEVSRKAYEIIDRKGATYYGIGACVASLCDTVLNDRRDIRPISCYNEQYDSYVSMPAIVGANGVEAPIKIQLNEAEQKKMERAVDAMKAVLAECN